MIVVKIGDIATQVRGVTFSKQDAQTDPTPTNVAIIRGGNIQSDQLEMSNLVYVPTALVSDVQRVRPGDIIVVTSSGSLAGIGKTAAVTAPIDAAAGGFLRVIRPGTGVDSRYLAHFFRTPGYRQKVSSKAAGANINNLRVSHIADLEIPLPPLEEQQRIAAILDQADTLRAKRRQVLDHLDTLTHSIFRGLFGGAGRERRVLKELSSWRSGGTPSRTDVDSFGGSIPWVSSGELGNMYVSDSREYLTERGIETSAAKKVKPGSVLVGMYDTAALKSSIATKEIACNQAIAFSTGLESGYSAEYVYWAIQAERRRVLALRRGVRQKNLNLSIIRQIDIPAATAAEVATFTQQARNIHESIDRSTKDLAVADALFASLQSRAFRGEL